MSEGEVETQQMQLDFYAVQLGPLITSSSAMAETNWVSCESASDSLLEVLILTVEKERRTHKACGARLDVRCEDCSEALFLLKTYYNALGSSLVWDTTAKDYLYCSRP